MSSNQDEILQILRIKTKSWSDGRRCAPGEMLQLAAKQNQAVKASSILNQVALLNNLYIFAAANATAWLAWTCCCWSQQNWSSTLSDSTR
jgi:hypothetical protein